jgi:hypothetical protein
MLLIAEELMMLLRSVNSARSYGDQAYMQGEFGVKPPQEFKDENFTKLCMCNITKKLCFICKNFSGP